MIVLPPEKVALVPSGKPLALSVPSLLIPIAPVVAWVIFVNAVLIHNVGELDATPNVLEVITIIVPVAFTALQPPINGIL